MTAETAATEVALDALDERYARLRVAQPRLCKAMTESLRRYGQLSPVVACPRGDALAVVDGFKRLTAARALEQQMLSVRVLPLTERAAVAAVYGLNRGGRGLVDLEEALVVRELVREQDLTQPEVGELLGRDKSWVSRRLMLVERLCPEVQDDVRVGLVSISVAREVARLPRGNQPEVAACVHNQGLTTRDAALLVNLFEQTTDREQQEALLSTPRELLDAHRGHDRAAPNDPRLGAAANKLRRQALWVAEGLASLDRMLPRKPAVEWTGAERTILVELLQRVEQTASSVAGSLARVTGALEAPDART
jgi:ParB family chromosome partitioning protein